MNPDQLLVTPQRLKALFSGLRPLELAAYPIPLDAALRGCSIDRPARVAAWLAQVGHESAGLMRWVESFAYSPERLQQVFPRCFPTAAVAREAVAGGVQTIAERVYGGRQDLGNVQPGDGWRYRGRGPIQLTGRANYARTGEALGLPLEADPDLAAQVHVGFRVAAWFWLTRELNHLADLETVEAFRAITHRINGGLNGWEDRLRRWREARAAFGLSAPAEQNKEA